MPLTSSAKTSDRLQEGSKLKGDGIQAAIRLARVSRHAEPSSQAGGLADTGPGGDIEAAWLVPHDSDTLVYLLCLSSLELSRSEGERSW